MRVRHASKILHIDPPPSGATAPCHAPDGYRRRATDAEVERALAAMPAVVIEGPKGCGKTWTGRSFARSEVLFDRDLNARRSVSLVPGVVLEGDEPRLLDEWQLAPEVWNQVRHASDEGHGTGRFILTGSAVPADDITRHSGAGRIARVRMRPMSLLETGESTGEVPLGALFEGERVAARSPDAGFRDVLDALCRGGWPRLLGQSVPDAQLFLDNYIADLCRTDVSSVDDSRLPAPSKLLIITATGYAYDRPDETTVPPNHNPQHLAPSIHRLSYCAYPAAYGEVVVSQNVHTEYHFVVRRARFHVYHVGCATSVRQSKDAHPQPERIVVLSVAVGMHDGNGADRPHHQSFYDRPRDARDLCTGVQQRWERLLRAARRHLAVDLNQDSGIGNLK